MRSIKTSRSLNWILTVATTTGIAACGSSVPLGIQDAGTGDKPDVATLTGGAVGLGTGGAAGAAGGTVPAVGSGGLAGYGGANAGGTTSSGATCRTSESTACPSGQFCDAVGSGCSVATTLSGTCVLTGPALACTIEYSPVCGCNGQTYGNDCLRRGAGVLKASDGACATGGKGGTMGTGGVASGGGTPGAGGTVGSGGVAGTGGTTGTGTSKRCGTIAGIGCPTGQFCDLASSCGMISDAAGVCVPTGPGVGCIAIVAPVCGCDGKTYGSDCERGLAGVLKAHDGACGAAGSGGATGSGGVKGSGGAAGGGGASGSGGASGVDGGTNRCGTLAGLTCADGQFCDLQSSCGAISDAAGTCKLTGPGTTCGDIYLPVCGCDGKTYPNDCTRILARVLKAADGVCAK